MPAFSKNGIVNLDNDVTAKELYQVVRNGKVILSTVLKEEAEYLKKDGDEIVVKDITLI